MAIEIGYSIKKHDIQFDLLLILGMPWSKCMRLVNATEGLHT